MAIEPVWQKKAGPLQLLAAVNQKFCWEGRELSRQDHRSIGAHPSVIGIDLASRDEPNAVDEPFRRDLRLEHIVIDIEDSWYPEPLRRTDKGGERCDVANPGKYDQRKLTESMNALVAVGDGYPFRVDTLEPERFDVVDDPVIVTGDIGGARNIKNAELAMAGWQHQRVFGDIRGRLGLTRVIPL